MLVAEGRNHFVYIGMGMNLGVTVLLLALCVGFRLPGTISAGVTLTVAGTIEYLFLNHKSKGNFA